MKKTEFNNLGLSLYEETLDNGLNVFIVPMENANNKYVTFTTRYGSTINEFIPIGGNDYVKVADNKWEYRSKQANVIGPDRTDDEVQKIVSDIYSQLNESKETLIEEDGESNKEFLTDRDKEIFDKLKNEPEEKTELDYIQDRIGQQITVDDLNRILQDIFRTDNKIYLLASDLYNMDLTSSQELVFFDDTDMYVINYDIIDMDEGIIEITDANVE